MSDRSPRAITLLRTACTIAALAGGACTDDANLTHVPQTGGAQFGAPPSSPGPGGHAGAASTTTGGACGPGGGCAAVRPTATGGAGGASSLAQAPGVGGAGGAVTGPDFVPSVMDLPILRIETEGHAPVVSPIEYVNATVTIDPNGARPSFAINKASAQVRGRGNSTWGMPKKPLKLKFSSKTSVLGMPADKEWALMANYTDKTLLRNSVALEMSRRLGMGYTPRSAFAEVFFNGGYIGTYL
ncbi:MAG TPA: CotH kinase family protein, partial [Polyangia bacterium]|nr:CotH kinase family protein [Polyangia bacterium]